MVEKRLSNTSCVKRLVKKICAVSLKQNSSEGEDLYLLLKLLSLGYRLVVQDLIFDIFNGY